VTAGFTIADLARVTGADVRGARGDALSRDAAGASLDSRRVAPGQVFVPLPGTRADGHAFIAPALAGGAAAALCARERVADVEAALAAHPARETFGPLLVVAEPQAALGAWAVVRRERWSGELVGLCGSNGKTTTKEMLAAIFAQRAPTGRTEGNLNNELGVPVTLTRLRGVERYAVVEIGMNHPGEVRALAALARPTAAVITNIAPEHLEGVGTLADVARAEAEVGEGLPPGAPLVVPVDQPLLLDCVRAFRARRVTFGLVPGADYVATDLEHLGPAGMRFRVPGFPPLAIPVPGAHSVRNALAALACAHVSGISPEECAAGLLAMARPAGRMEVATWGGVTLLLDHYNANPGSVAAALETLRSWPGASRRFAALGDMLELGPEAPAYHAEVGRAAAALDGAFLWGALMEHAGRAAAEAGAGARVRHFAGRGELGRALAAQLRPGDVVLVKGSRGSAMEEVLEVLRAALAGRDGGEGNGAAHAAAGEGR
jgi:UDP-N-acetylmuramoyl-tripeptide--D-alanyl-D-alanine ligase